MASNRAELEPQGRADWTREGRVKAGVVPKPPCCDPIYPMIRWYTGSQHGDFGMTPALTRAPFVRLVGSCALNTARFTAVPGSKRNPCERWQGVKLVGVLDLIVCQTENVDFYPYSSN